MSTFLPTNTKIRGSLYVTDRIVLSPQGSINTFSGTELFQSTSSLYLSLDSNNNLVINMSTGSYGRDIQRVIFQTITSSAIEHTTAASGKVITITDSASLDYRFVFSGSSYVAPSGLSGTIVTVPITSNVMTGVEIANAFSQSIKNNATTLEIVDAHTTSSIVAYQPAGLGTLVSNISSSIGRITASIATQIQRSTQIKPGTEITNVVFSRTDDRPQLGIGGTPETSFDVLERVDDSDGTKILLRASRINVGALPADKAGSIRFSVDSASFSDTAAAKGIFNSGSTAEINSTVETVTSAGVVGDLRFLISKTKGESEPEDHARFAKTTSYISSSWNVQDTLTSQNHVHAFATNVVSGENLLTVSFVTASHNSLGNAVEYHVYDLLVKVIGSEDTVPSNTLYYSSKVLMNRGLNDKITFTEYSAPITDASGSNVILSASISGADISLHALNTDASTMTVYGTRV